MKEDLRQMEGDVLLRRRRMQLARQRFGEHLADISRASVIISASSGLVLAVRFAPMMTAPRVIAKAGRRRGCALIGQARHAGIAVVEDNQLAVDLFSSCRVGADVPPRLHEKIAEVLAYAQEITQRRGGAGTGGADDSQTKELNLNLQIGNLRHLGGPVIDG
jgi:flagellar biosynthetic protein FlhB